MSKSKVKKIKMLLNTCGYEVQSIVCTVIFATVGHKELCVLASVMSVCVCVSQQ